MQITIELNDTEVAALQAEIDSFPASDPQNKPTLEFLVRGMLTTALTQLVEQYRSIQSDQLERQLASLPTEDFEEAKAEIDAVLAKYRLTDDVGIRT